jgi:hypothetical protein
VSETPPYPPNQPPNQPPSQPPGQYPPPGHYPPQSYYPVPAVPPNSGKATTSLVLGIVSIFVCGLFLGIPAMIVARQAKREIEESHGRLGGSGLATAGFVTGLIGTVISVVVGLLVVLLIAFGVLYADKHCSNIIDESGSSNITCDDT